MSSKIRAILLVTILYVVVIVTSSDVDIGFNHFTSLTENENNDVAEGRKKKHKKNQDHHKKYVTPLIMTALLIKAILFPLAIKAMAAMTSISVILSVLSLLVSSIVGYTKYAADVAYLSTKRYYHQGLKKNDYQQPTLLEGQTMDIPINNFE